MFTTVEHVKELTNYDVTNAEIVRAQSIIESYVGRVEAEVVYPTDRELLSKAVAYQTAYLHENAETIFEQMALSYMGQFGQALSFRAGDFFSPFVAPLAMIACQKLSWKRIRSVKTGSLFGPTEPVDWRTV